MPVSASSEKEYFLGIGGQQTGPYSEREIWDKIRAGEIPDDTLVWYEGMSDWQPITSLDNFRDLFPNAAVSDMEPAPDADAPKRPKKKPAKKKKKGKEVKSNADLSRVPSFALDGKLANPIFSNSESTFARNVYLKRKMKFVFLGIFATLMLYGGYRIYDSGFSFFPVPGSDEEGESVGTKPKFGRKQGGAKVETRETQLENTKSELLVSPDRAVPELIRLYREKMDDEVGKKAFELAAENLKARQKTGELGRLFMLGKKYLEASQMFLSEPPSYTEAEEAIQAALQDPNIPGRKELLIQDIKLLLGPLQKASVATERIRQFVKEYPKEPNPFGYYLMSIDEKVVNIFPRISFQFVEQLNQYFLGEFTQVELMKRPVVEVVREKNGKYRIVGKYRGDVRLRRDTLTDIWVTAWLVRGAWFIVDTNITEERRKSSAQVKAKLRDESEKPEVFLEFLENTFHSRYPRNGLHEKITEKVSKNPSQGLE